MRLAALAGFTAGTAIVVYTFLRQHSTPASVGSPEPRPLSDYRYTSLDWVLHEVTALESDPEFTVSYEMGWSQVRADPTQGE